MVPFQLILVFAGCYYLYLLLKVGTLCCLACLSVWRLKSKDWFPPTWGRAFTSAAPKTETSQCGAVEQFWPTCPPSALHGSVRKNMRSTGRRSSSGSASETAWGVHAGLCNVPLHLISPSAIKLQL